MCTDVFVSLIIVTCIQLFDFFKSNEYMSVSICMYVLSIKC